MSQFHSTRPTTPFAAIAEMDRRGEVIEKLEAKIETLEAEISALKEKCELHKDALLPFYRFSVNVSKNDEWVSTVHNAKVSYWFNPSDFRRVRTAYTT